MMKLAVYVSKTTRKSLVSEGGSSGGNALNESKSAPFRYLRQIGCRLCPGSNRPLTILVAIGLIVILHLLTLALPLPVFAAEPTPPVEVRQLLETAHRMHSEERAGSAAKAWQEVLQQLPAGRYPRLHLSILDRLSQTLQGMGFHGRAIRLMEKARSLPATRVETRVSVKLLSRLADLHLSFGNLKQAESVLSEAIPLAQKLNDALETAALLNNLGNLFNAYGLHGEAATAYDRANQSLAHADEAADPLRIKIGLNLLRVALKGESRITPDQAAHSLRNRIDRLPAGAAQVGDYLALARICRQFLVTDPQRSVNMRPLAHESLARAASIASTLNDARLRSLAYGQRGQLYEDAADLENAQSLTRRAIFFANQGAMADILYLWQWQLGRLQRAQNRTSDAIATYKRAIATLEPIRRQMLHGFRRQQDMFAERVKPIYLELVDLFLQSAVKASSKAVRDELLMATRDTMEGLKTAELEDIFQDECVAAEVSDGPGSGRNGSPATAHRNIEPDVALLYPIPLEDRLALLLEFADGLTYISVPVTAGKLNQAARRLRRHLQSWDDFEDDAQNLYRWLIAPISDALAARHIQTLVVAPEGALRLIPFAALWSGDQFLVEQYAVVTIPAFDLTDPRRVSRTETRVLINGLTKAKTVGDMRFSDLPGVRDEVSGIRKLLGGEILLDEAYTVENLANAFKQTEYSILHLATHGFFGGSPDETFLLTHDGTLTMNRLEWLIGLSRFRKQKVELLTLSACQTAEGDERAAFGLAGVAVKAGVKSALATLWSVDDQAAAQLIHHFYTLYKQPGMTKARALQKAQLNLLEQPRYWHPSFWSCFLLIGNWY